MGCAVIVWPDRTTPTRLPAKTTFGGLPPPFPTSPPQQAWGRGREQFRQQQCAGRRDGGRAYGSAGNHRGAPQSPALQRFPAPFLTPPAQPKGPGKPGPQTPGDGHDAGKRGTVPVRTETGVWPCVGWQGNSHCGWRLPHGAGSARASLIVLACRAPLRLSVRAAFSNSPRA